MVIDSHGHMISPSELVLYREFLIGSRGSYGRTVEHLGTGMPTVKGGKPTRDGVMTPELLTASATEHIKWLDAVGTDMQLISARPYNLMHSERPTKIIHWWIEALNNAIALQVDLFPTRFAGLVNLPQVYGEPIDVTFDELERRMTEGDQFVGVLVNPDPSEGKGYVPPMGHEYWYPLYEKLVQHQAPIHIHSAGCIDERLSHSLHFINEESIAVMSLLEADIFTTFPDLKIVVAHGGGAIPYQVGRFRNAYWEDRGIEGTFDENLKKLYFDSCMYSRESIELLIKTVGPDRILLGTERPGDGSGRESANGHEQDDIKSLLEDIDWLTQPEREAMLEGNARSVFTRLDGRPIGE